MSGTWIDTLNERRDAAAQPRSLEELQPAPAVQGPAGGPAVDVAGMIRDEVAKQMDSFAGRLEALFGHPTPPAEPTAPAPTAPAPAEQPAASAPADPSQAPAAAPQAPATGNTSSWAPPAAESGSQPA